MTSFKNSKSMIGLFAVVFVFFVILISFAFVTYNSFFDGGMDQTIGSQRAKIAVVTVEGAIMTSRETIELLHVAEKDKNIEAIILKINSPGGAVGPTQEIYEEIIRIDTVKPIYASFESVAASGGYYLAAATRKIFTNAGALTGSIGVIMQFVDLSKLYELAKVNPQTIKAGKYKDIGSQSRAMTSEESALMNKTIQNVHKQFIDDIMKRREGKIKGDINEIAQGQIYSGQEALELGLVDEIGGLWATGRSIHKELGIKEPFALRFIEKRKSVNLMELLSAVNENLKGLSVESLMHSSSVPRIMFK